MAKCSSVFVLLLYHHGIIYITCYYLLLFKQHLIMFHLAQCIRKGVLLGSLCTAEAHKLILKEWSQ